MNDALLIGLVAVSALICPAMMPLGRRRGRSMLCCPPRAGRNEAADLRRRQIALGEEINRRIDQAAAEQPTDSLA